MKKLISTILTLICITNGYSQMHQEQGSAQYPYKPGAFSGKPKSEEYQQAIKAAKLDALRRYKVTLDQNTQLNFDKISSSISADIDLAIPNFRIIKQDYDKGTKLITINFIASIDTSYIKNQILRNSPAMNVPSKEKSYVCGAFVARRQTSVTSFKTKRVDISRNDISTEDFEEVASDGTTTSVLADQRIERSSTTGGTSTNKADDILWDVFPSEVLDASMSGILKTAGYRLVPAKMLGRKSEGLISIEALNQDYSTGNDLSPTTQEDFAEGCANLKIAYLSTGTMSVQTPRRDPIGGNILITVNVNAQVLDVSGFFPEVVASIGPVQYSAEGDTQTTAEINAIKLASVEAGRLIVAGLQQANAQ